VKTHTPIKKAQKDVDLAELGLSLPVVVKPCSGGSSIGVYIVNTEDEYREAIEKSFKYEDEVVIEPYIKGREFACGIIDGKPLGHDYDNVACLETLVCKCF
jgi:D-alanine-D-alanine ligase